MRVTNGLWLGILDAIDSIGEPAAQVIERAALGAGHSSVRLAALRRMAQRDPEAAATLAAGDPNQRVRAQASTLGARVEPVETAGSAGPTSADPDRPTAEPEQPTLF